VSVGVVTDSSCDLPQPLADELGLRIVPLTVRFGTAEYLDRRDLTPSEFWARCAASPVAPETAAPAPGMFEALYRRLAEAGADGVLAVTVSGMLSGTAQSAQLAARSVEHLIRVEVVDSRTVSAGLGMIAAAAAREAQSGVDLDRLLRHTLDLSERTEVWAMLDSLHGLRQGGRVGATKAAIAEAFSVKPIVQVRDGHIERRGRIRTRTRALEALVAKVRAAGPLTTLGVLHADAGDVDGFVEALAPLAPGPITVTDVGPVIGSHCGRRAVGVAFQTERERPLVCREVDEVLH
jgi:fatty acid kinase fatty acid binding subunit